VHYDVQLFGGTVLHKGKIAEMGTGEGKTLVATLPVFLNALTRNGVHVVTVNDYLSKRDSEWMGPLYMFHGLSVDCIDKHRPNSDERRTAYMADITFGTNNEFGFDYLRDNMATSPSDGLNWCTPTLPIIFGTQRAALLQSAKMIEKDISKEDLCNYSRIRLFNAMIEFGEIELDINSLIL
jgi:hypothetical protein